MEIVDYLLARKKAGGSDVTIEQLSVTENGTYSEQGIAYSPVVVDVPAPENSYQLKDVPSGTISTIEDGTDLPMSSLKVDIEPVQDLHGYDHPWVGGAGKNLFPYLQNETTYGVTLTVDKDGTITLNGTCTTSYNFMVSGTIEAGNYSLCDFAEGQWPSTQSRTQVYGENVISLIINNPDSSQTVRSTIVENDGAVTFRVRIENGFTYNNNKLKPMLIKETVSTMTYEPYSNICPISGWTAANVTRSGKNILNTDDITPIFVGAATRNGLYFRKSGQYTVSAQNSGDYLYCRIFNADSTIKETYHIVSMSTITNATFTISDGEYFAVFDAMEGSINISKTRFNSWLCQVELGSTATTYEPYNGTTYNVQFRDGDNPLTVYGGTLDVTSGELVVDRVSVDMGDLTWAYDASYDRFASNDIPNSEPPSGARITPFISSMYEVIDDGRPVSQVTSGQMYSSFNSTQTNAIVMVHDNRFIDATAFKTAVTGQTFVYELAEPITYHLTSTQVRTLVGNNNIWADTGDVLSGKYFKEL